MKKCIIILALGLACIVLLANGAQAAEPNRYITEKQFQSLREGMTKHEINKRFHVRPTERAVSKFDAGLVLDTFYGADARLVFLKKPGEKRWHLTWFRYYGDYGCAQQSC